MKNDPRSCDLFHIHLSLSNDFTILEISFLFSCLWVSEDRIFGEKAFFSVQDVTYLVSLTRKTPPILNYIYNNLSSKGAWKVVIKNRTQSITKGCRKGDIKIKGERRVYITKFVFFLQQNEDDLIFKRTTLGKSTVGKESV